MKLIERYNKALNHEHGWEEDLTCPQCGHTGAPAFDGWTPKREINFGSTPTIYAKLSCTECDCDLRGQAEVRLIGLFEDVATPPANRRLLLSFLSAVVAAPLAIAALVFLGIQLDWWDARAYLALVAVTAFIGPTSMWFNFRVASLRQQCGCGSPAYKFMGLLGRSYCYRCSNCANRLRLRD